MPVLLLLLAGCRTAIPVSPEHVVFADTYGNLVDPTGSLQCGQHEAEAESRLPWNSPRGWEPCYGKTTPLYNRNVQFVPEYYEEMFSASRTFSEPLTCPEERHVRRLTVVVHGGLRTNAGNLEASKELAPKIRATGTYPVFIVWQSNLGGSLIDHYFKLVGGENKGWSPWALGAPFKLARDLGAGLIHLPVDVATHFRREASRTIFPFRGNATEGDEIFVRLRERYERNCATGPCDEIAISRGPWKWEPEEGRRSFDSNFVFTFLVPTKIVAMPVIKGAGTSAWNAMIRHVHVNFRHEDGGQEESTHEGWPEIRGGCGSGECVDDTTAERAWGGAGAVSLFFRRLREEIRNSPGTEWEINLIGHSMGGIMVNEIIRQFPDLPFSNIVYMASAASIADYEGSAIPYLLAADARARASGATDRSRLPHVWHLVLHPFAEVREEYAGGMAPSGSLLVWIDDYLSDPRHFRERTAGRYSNLMPALPYTPTAIRDLVSVKVFGVGKAVACTDPQNHGGFLKLDGSSKECAQLGFWTKAFWTPDGPQR